MIIYSEMEPTANIVRDEEQAVYHRMPWWKRNICNLTIRSIPILSLNSSTHLLNPREKVLYSLKIHLWIHTGCKTYSQNC
jgi:hypothetical protein